MTGPSFRRLGCVTLVAAHLTACGLAPVLAEPASPRFTAWQEMVLLTVMKARHAATSCGFRVDQGQTDAILASAALSEADVERQAFSPSLKRQAAADADLYLDGKEAACSQAWERYGADGAPGIRNTLTR